MGDIFEELGKKITETADIISKRTARMLDIQKLQNQIRSLEKGNDRDYQEIGKSIYDCVQQGLVVEGEEYLEICEQVTKRKEIIEKLKKQLEELKGCTKCPECGETVLKDMAFCPGCGTKLQKEEPEGQEDIFEEETVDSQEEVIEDLNNGSGE